MKRYDDDLRIFLVSCLKKIEYLNHPDIKEEVLAHIAMHMIA